jgi:hypothetical protein
MRSVRSCLALILPSVTVLHRIRVVVVVWFQIAFDGKYFVNLTNLVTVTYGVSLDRLCRTPAR